MEVAPGARSTNSIGHRRQSRQSGQGQTTIRHVPFKLNTLLLQKQWESLLKIQKSDQFLSLSYGFSSSNSFWFTLNTPLRFAWTCSASHSVSGQPTLGHRRQSNLSGQDRTRICHVPFKLNSLLLQKQW